MKTDRKYWMTFDAKDLASELCGYHDIYSGQTLNPISSMWVRNRYAYYSTILEADSWLTALGFTGDQGELVRMCVPQARSLIRQILTLTTKQKLAFKAIARVSKTEVTEAVRIANALAAQTVKKQSLDLKQTTLVEDGLVVGSGFIGALWRTDRGLPRAVEERPDGTKDVIYDGDLEIVNPDIGDVLFDFSIEHWEDQEWVDVRFKRSRWSLIAQHPELEEEILKLPSCNSNSSDAKMFGIGTNDMVWTRELYHKPTPALPRGRMMMYSNPKTIYADDINEYGCIPFEQLKPESIRGIGYGYPMLSNLLPSQEMYDHDLSAIATNHSALGVQNVAVPRGANVGVTEIMGMNFIQYDALPTPGGGKPEPLQLVNSSSELFKLPEVLLSNMQQMANINQAVRGEMPSSTSGVAIATLTTNALEFLSDYTKSCGIVMEKIMMHSINAYRRFANTERLVSIVGKNYQAFDKPFTGDILDPIQSIEMQAVNPLLLTMAGRLEVADKSMANGLIKDMQAYSSVLDGNPLEDLYDVELSENDLIKSENEMMIDGEKPLPLSSDNHPLHIYRHKAMLNDPRIRRDSARVQIILDHMADHDDLAKNTDPFFMAMANTGQMPEGGPPQPEQEMPMGPEGAAPQGEQPPPGPDMPMAEMAEGDEMEDAGVGLRLPSAKPAKPAQDLLGRSP